MRTKDLQESEEKRAYYQLLRYLVGSELRTSYGEDQPRTLHEELEHHEPSKIH